ncbi:MAG: hypothetical protein QNJ44_12350 [Rhodobacter sp.]|nr:hypothetical protein [Rhodobacter sp.]
MRLAVGFAMVIFLAQAGARAEPIDGDEARRMLFQTRGFAVQMVEDSGLDGTHLDYIRALVKTREFKSAAHYYGAIALSPAYFDRLATEGAAAALSGLFQVSDGLHSPDAASAVALDACNKARRQGEAKCELAARILPKRWKPRPVSLSSDATAAFTQYRRADAPKAFAVSRLSKAFSVVSGDGASETALDRCNRQAAAAGRPGCEIVIED